MPTGNRQEAGGSIETSDRIPFPSPVSRMVQVFVSRIWGSDLVAVGRLITQHG